MQTRLAESYGEVMRILMLLGVLLLVQACVVAPVRRPPPSKPMGYNEAVGLGFQFCRSRGYECKLKEAHLRGRDVWKVKFRASTRTARGHLHLDYQAYSRELLRVDESVRARRDDHDHHDDDDDRDDDGRGHGRKRGHTRHDD